MFNSFFPATVDGRKTVQTSEPNIPYGMRFLAPARITAQDTTGMRYDPELQIAVGADGNPWTTLVGADTTSTTNNDSRDDEGTDVW